MGRGARWTWAAVALLVLGGLAGGAAWVLLGPDRIDPRRAEREIARDYERQVEGDRVERVRCPDEIDGEPGAVVRCTVRLDDGRSGSVRVEVRDDGRLRWDVEAPRGG